MLIRFLSILTILLSCSSYQPVVQNEDTLSVPANDASLISANVTGPITEEECQQIFDELKRAKGFLPTQKPFLKFVRSLSNPNLAMALTDNSKGIVEVEKRLISMCNEKLGSDNRNGLAFILSHELAHFFKSHNVVHPAIKGTTSPDREEEERINVMTTNSEVQTSELEQLRKEFKEISRKYNVRKNESEADLEAGFLSYLAGYTAIAAGPKFLKEAYEFYNLDTAGGQYPSLSQRQEIVKTVARELDTLTRVFEAANFLTVTGLNDQAQTCYQRVLDDYKSVDIYNNMGVVTLKKAADNFEFDKLQFVVPLTISLSPASYDRAYDFVEGMNWDTMMMEEYRIAIAPYHEARDYLLKAAEVNPEVYEPHLNLSIYYLFAYHIQQEYSTVNPLFKDQLTYAKAAALKARECLLNQEREAKPLADVMTMLGILAHKMGDVEGARKNFEDALKIHPENETARINLRLMNGAPFFDVMQDMSVNGNGFNTCAEEEKLRGEISTIDFIQRDEIEWYFSTVVKEIKGRFVSDTMGLDMGRTQDADIYNISVYRKDNVKERYTYVSTNSSYNHGSACGPVQRGDKIDKVRLNYGNDGLMTEARSKTIISYNEKGISSDEFHDGIIFDISADGTVSALTIFNYKD